MGHAYTLDAWRGHDVHKQLDHILAPTDCGFTTRIYNEVRLRAWDCYPPCTKITGGAEHGGKEEVKGVSGMVAAGQTRIVNIQKVGAVGYWTRGKGGRGSEAWNNVRLTPRRQRWEKVLLHGRREKRIATKVLDKVRRQEELQRDARSPSREM